MFQNYLKITLRNLAKNKLFVFINILGLGVALSCCIVAYLNWDYNAKFDANYVDTEDVYRVNFKRITNGVPIQNGNCPMPLAKQIEGNFPQVEEVARVVPLSGNFKVGPEVFRSSVTAVDPSFFELFQFEVQSGQLLSSADKQSIVISSELQEKYFLNQADPVGESLTYLVGDQELIYQIVGVFAKPQKNSSFAAEAYIPFDNALEVQEWEGDNWAFFNTTFLRIPDAGSLAQVEQQLQAYVEVQNNAKEDYKVDSYYLDPFVGMAVRAEREDTWNHWFRNSLPVAAAVSPGIMAFLILLIACFNFTNTSIAIANRRIKEIGIRKVLGSGRRALILQFMGENTLMVLLSLLMGLLISVFFVPAYSAMWPFLEIKLNLLQNGELVLFLLGLLLFAALIAGSYPAFYISSFQPTTILRGRVKFSGTNSLTRILLTLQFAISLLAVIAGFVFAQNSRFQAEYDMGYDLDQTVITYVKDEQGYQKMVNQLQGYGKIKEMAGSANSISASWYTDPIRYNNNEELDVTIFDIGTNYLQAVGATLMAGRDFVPNSRSDMENSVLVNQELVKTMGWTEPLGQRIILKDTIALNVVGVVKDIYFKGGLWDPIAPTLMRY
ncbi:MAG: ABC transporter permease, partial [Bacteroidota bacterium]